MGTKQGLFNRENCAKKHTVYAITIVLISLLFLNSVAFADLNIYTEAELRSFSSSVTGGNLYTGQTVYLMNDIAMSSTKFPPIGNSTYPFGGTFDGQGYTVSGLNINTSTTYTGFFGKIGSTGVVKNLTISGAVVGGVNGASYVGGISGHCEGRIERCINNCTVQGNYGSGSTRIGGITGRLYGGTVTMCINNGVVSNCYREIGGIVGSAASGATISQCGNTANVNAGSNIGGICGLFDNGTCTNVFNTAQTSGALSTDNEYLYGIGNLIGQLGSNATLSNGYTVIGIGNTASGTGGYIVGLRKGTASTITNCHYYDGNWGFGPICYPRNETSGCTRYTTKNNLKLQSTVNSLNASQSPLVWSTDVQNINSGFPIFMFMIKVNEATSLQMNWQIPASTTIKLPIPQYSSNSYVVDWGDDSTDVITTTAFPSHTYTTAGLYTIKISGNVVSFGYFDSTVPTTGNAYSDYYPFTTYLRGVSRLGQLGCTSMGFSNCSGMTSFTSYHTGCTSGLTSFAYFFNGCSSLTNANLDISTVTTSNVTSYASMFKGCTGLTSIPLTNISTSSATNLSNMFNGCTGITSIDVSGFTTSVATNMSGMFQGCTGLTYLDLSNFNTASATTEAAMFKNCSSLGVILLGNNFGKLNGSEIFSGVASPCAVITERDAVFTSCDTSIGVGSNTKLYVYGKTLETTFEGNSNTSSAFGGASKIQPILELIPDNPMRLQKNATFTDPGYTVAGISGTNTSHPIFTVFGYQVESTNNVNTSTPGTYTVNYGLTRVTS